ncbi:MAG: hypothetical protein BGO41_09925 [Clostridiales bacterium 38-18]|nr:MAG: hypothetical protein BGO41_09925 [Clostridiales bacterium 38-18]
MVINTSKNTLLDSYISLATENTKEKFKTKDVNLVKVTSMDDAAVSREIKRLEQWEAHVVSHEKMHLLTSGGLAGAPSYTYTYGPDGKKYIQGGEVKFYLPSGLSLENGKAAVEKLKAAATAPTDPSPSDQRASAMASAIEIALENKLILKKIKESYEKAKEQREAFDSSFGENASVFASFKFNEVSGFELFI